MYTRSKNNDHTVFVQLSQAETELRHKCRLLEDSQNASGKWNGVGAGGSPASITNGGSTTDYGSLTPDDYRSLDVLRDEVMKHSDLFYFFTIIYHNY